MVMQSQLSTSTKMSHERAQQAIQDQALLEGRIMNAKSPCGPSRKTDNVRFRAAVGDKRTSDAPLPSFLIYEYTA
jgi:hypothetical protein